MQNRNKSILFEKESSRLRTTSIDVPGMRDSHAQNAGSNIISAGCTGVQRLENWSVATVENPH